MGFGGISIWQLLIILAIVLLLFGTKRLRNLGGDLGGALKGFRKAMKDDDKEGKEGEGEEEEDEEPGRLERKESEKPQHKTQSEKDKQSQDK